MARWQSCNILHVGAETRQVWEFDARRGDFVLSGERSVPNGPPLPPSIGGRTWRSLWQKKLNVAWLPPEQVFLRAVQLPAASFEETRAMVELQLEKLSPLPLAQVVWTLHVLPQIVEQQQTVIVIIVSRALVEEFLGQLEVQGYLADRLEVGMLDQLVLTPADRDGAWLYPDSVGGRDTALVAWWFNGAMQQLSFVSAPPGEKRGEILCAQLAQTAWAGELEGWLKSTPRLYVVAAEETAAQWEALLREGLRETVEIVKPRTPAELAAATAKRAAQAPANSNLLPTEFTSRYQQQFIDRLWMRGLGTLLALYICAVGFYLGGVWFKKRQVSSVKQQIANLGQSYTNTLKLRDQFQILKDRQDLKYAALECWKAFADLLPPGAVADSFDFSDGKKLVINGTAPADLLTNMHAFSHELGMVQVEGRPLFSRAETLWQTLIPPGSTMAWRVSYDLSRLEGP